MIDELVQGADNPETSSKSTVNDNEKSSDAEEKLLRQKTIRIENLRHPGGWLTNTQLQRLLNKSRKFDVIFERAPEAGEKHIKLGKIRIEFSTIDSAREAYVTLQKIVVDGARPTISVDPEFFEAASTISTNHYFSPSEDSELIKRTIYAIYLPKSADKKLLECIVGTDVIESFKILEMPNNEELIQAEIIVNDEETATSLPADGEDFPIDDGEQMTMVKLLSTANYMELVKKETAAKPFAARNEKENEIPAKKLENGEIDEQSAEAKEKIIEHSLAPEIEEDEIINKLFMYIEDQRINFAEINEIEELYEICDVISAVYNGLPDSLLKSAMLEVLQTYLNRTEMHWMREHIETLIKKWKGEVMSEVFFDRPTVVRMETVDYKPQIEVQSKKSSSKKSKVGKELMGVGAFLQQNRKLIVEQGSVNLEEDDEGNVIVGGETLSFESWAKITKVKANGVVRATDEIGKKMGTVGLSRKQIRLARIVEGMNQEEYLKWKKEKTENRKYDLKVRIMKRGLEIENDDNEMSNPDDDNEKKELDEGEIDSEEERKMEKQKKMKEPKKKKKKKIGTTAGGSSSSDSKSSSSNSSSSSSEDDDDGTVDARQRRRSKRKKDRKNNRSSSMQPKISPMFKAMFDNRKAIVAKMSPAHKLAFANVLNQIRQSNASISHSQATQMMNAMFNGGGGGGGGFK